MNENIQFKDGKLVVTVEGGKEVTPGVSVTGHIEFAVSARAVLDKLKELVPGHIDDTIIEAIEEKLGL